MSDTTILVDVSNLAFRSHFVMPSLSYNGKLTGMFHGFLSTVRALQKLNCGSLVFCWDYGTPPQPRVEPWRKAIYPPYKENRVKSPELAIVIDELNELFKVLCILGYPCIGVPGLEADDIMGLLTSRPGEFFLFSTDDDLYQLLDGMRVRVLRRKKAWRYVNQRDVQQQFGFPITQFPAYLAFGGDHSDNIRPIKGCGPAGALSLVLAGADPLLPFDKQPQAARNARHAPAWASGDVLKAYQVAHIPRNVKDWRIKALVEAHPLPKSLLRETDDIEHREEELLHFLSLYGLMDHIAQRSKFFWKEANHEKEERS